MKSLRIYGARDLRMSDETIPTPGPGEELIQVTAVGLCGSDIHWYSEGGIGSNTIERPLVLGHEFAAVIAAGPRKGTRVAVDPALPCMECESCQEGNPNVCPNVRFAGHAEVDGAMREYMTWPSHAIFPIPDNLSFAGGTLLETLGVAMHAINLGPITPADKVAVLGCGPVGLLTIQMARLAGATRIFATDRIASRLEMAGDMGATDLLLADDASGEAAAISKATAGRGMDVVYEAAGDPAAVETAVRACKAGGRVVLIGIPVEDRTSFTASIARRKGLTIMISRRMKHTYPRAIDLASSGKVDLKSLVTHSFTFGDFDKAFQTAVKRTGIKVILDLQS
jgi:L-iditol 2-dehydrogenase